MVTAAVTVRRGAVAAAVEVDVRTRLLSASLRTDRHLHLVRTGETLFSIARQYDARGSELSIADIAFKNGLSLGDAHELRPGRLLDIPASVLARRWSPPASDPPPTAIRRGSGAQKAQPPLAPLRAQVAAPQLQLPWQLLQGGINSRLPALRAAGAVAVLALVAAAGLRLFSWGAARARVGYEEVQLQRYRRAVGSHRARARVANMLALDRGLVDDRALQEVAALEEDPETKMRRDHVEILEGYAALDGAYQRLLRDSMGGASAGAGGRSANKKGPPRKPILR
eukprot:SM000255S08787  [mRNA]  locus=s255:53342:55376:- [translate_table: standard]